MGTRSELLLVCAWQGSFGLQGTENPAETTKSSLAHGTRTGFLFLLISQVSSLLSRCPMIAMMAAISSPGSLPAAKKESLSPASPSKHLRFTLTGLSQVPVHLQSPGMPCNSGLRPGIRAPPGVVTEARIQNAQIGLSSKTESGVKLTHLRMGRQRLTPVKTEICYQEEG